MFRKSHRFATFAVLSALAFAACSKEEDKKAGLVVALQTDMSIPKDIDSVDIEVSTFGNVMFSNRYYVGEDGLRIPATLTLLPPEKANTPVTIRVISYKKTKDHPQGAARTLRKVITTVPENREALLRMPIQWLCDGQVEEVGEDSWKTTCKTGNSCQTGSCVPDEIDSKDLPDYNGQDLFGGVAADKQGGVCFDTVPCLAGSTLVGDALDLETCTIDISGDSSMGGASGTLDPSKLNFGLSMPPGSDGICGEDEAEQFGCFVPLDSDELAGWSVTDSTIHIPKGVCTKLSASNAVPVSLVVSDACPAKTADIPTCGPWSAVDGQNAITVDLPDGAGGMGGGPNAMPTGGTGNQAYVEFALTPDMGNLSNASPAFTAKVVPTYESSAQSNPSAITSPATLTFDGSDLCIEGYFGSDTSVSYVGYYFSPLNIDPAVLGLAFHIAVGPTADPLPSHGKLVVTQLDSQSTQMTDYCVGFTTTTRSQILFKDLVNCSTGTPMADTDPSTFLAMQIQLSTDTPDDDVSVCLEQIAGLYQP